MGRKNSKDDANASSAESGNSSGEETEAEYVVEKVVDKRIVKGKVSAIFESKAWGEKTIRIFIGKSTLNFFLCIFALVARLWSF